MAHALSRRAIARYTAEQLAGGKDAASVMNQLAAYLVTHGKTKLASRYVADIEAELAVRGVVVADVTTARPLSGDTRNDIESLIVAKTGGRQVALREHVDETIIGGIIIRTAGKEYDRSLQNAIRNLRGV